MINSIGKEINEWYFKDHKLLHLHDHKSCFKSLLILSNLIYIIILLILLRLKIRNKWFLILLFVSIFIISSLYHYYQCYNSNYNYYTTLKCCDIIFILFFIIVTFALYKIKMNLKIILLLIISLIIWNKQNDKNLYVYYHSLWHILSGLTVFLIFYELRDE